MKLVEAGKLSAEDAAELIDAFASGDQAEREEPAAAEAAQTAEPGKHAEPHAEPKEPFKSFVDVMERLGKDIRQVNWSDVARQVREGAERGVHGLKSGVEKIRDGRWGWLSSEQREITLPLSVPQGKTLRIENPSGDVKVARTGNLGTVKAYAKFRGQDDVDARLKAEAYTLIVEESEHSVLIRHPDVSGLSADLEIELPDAAPISVHTDSGDVLISGTGSSAKVTCRSGDVRIKGVNGAIEVNLNDGDLAIEDSESPSITIESKSGDLAFRRVAGNLNVRTANGDIAVVEASCKTLSLESVSGDISLMLSEPVRGTVNVRTVNGDVSARISPASDARVSLSTLRGEATCSVQLQEEVRTGQRLTGRLGDGAGVIDISAVNGDVSLGFHDAPDL